MVLRCSQRASEDREFPGDVLAPCGDQGGQRALGARALEPETGALLSLQPLQWQ